MSTAYEERYTRADYVHWQNDWELINGHPCAMAPSPSFEHQNASGKIFRQLDEKLDDCPECHAVYELDVEFSDDTIVRPDVMVICYKPTSKLTRAPEMVFEVISGSTAKRDEILKYELYAREGVKYYTMVYPESRKAKSYELIEGRYRKIADFSQEAFQFELSKCDIKFDFTFVWRI